MAYQMRVNGVINTKQAWVHDGTLTVRDVVRGCAVGGAVVLSLPRATGDGRLAYTRMPEEGAKLPASLDLRRGDEQADRRPDGGAGADRLQTRRDRSAWRHNQTSTSPSRSLPAPGSTRSSTTSWP